MINEGKNIDRLFQEKMKELEGVPSSRVWTEIELKLQKKKRRILPFWWFSGGIAALLIVSLFLFPFIDDDLNKNKIDLHEVITITPENLVKKIDTNSSNKLLTFPVFKEKEMITAKKKSGKRTSNAIAEKTSLYNQRESSKIEEKEINPLFPKRALIKNNDSNKPIDTIQKRKEKKKLLFPKKDFIASLKKDSTTIKNVSEKWSVAPVFAVLNSSSFSGSSPIVNTSSGGIPIEGNTSTSYGIKINYKISSKWTIQSGVHLQKMRYSTKNESTTTSVLDISTIESVNIISLPNSQGLTGLSTGQNFINLWQTNDDAILDQSFNYIEFPIEIKYTIISGKKLNTHLVTGFSSLFLATNRVYLKSERFSRLLGQASNLNSINFSGNFGVDFDYYFDKHWTLNINPMFKTQLNTLSENTSNFRPYSIGIYSGIKYSF